MSSSQRTIFEAGAVSKMKQ